MAPADSSPAHRRVALYFFIVLAVILAPLFFAFWAWKRSAQGADDFARVMSVGKNYYDKNEAAKAIGPFLQAVQLQPTHPDALLNLANAYLLAGESENALKYALEALAIEPQSAAAFYVAGAACLRLRQFEEAVKWLQQAKDIDRRVNAVSFQLGRAYFELGRFEEAAEQFQEILSFEPGYPSANYMLSQALIRLGRADEANEALRRHQELQARKPTPSGDPSIFERCVYTEARVPFELEQPETQGIQVTFADATRDAFGADAANYRGPAAVLNINRRGANDLVVTDGTRGFRILMNEGGRFTAQGDLLAGREGSTCHRLLVGDVNNDRYEDVVAIGTGGVQLFKLGTNAAAQDIGTFARVGDIPAEDGLLLDLDFTGKLDLLLVTPGDRRLRILRNIGSSGGNPYFRDITQTSGIPQTVTGLKSLVADDWNHDDINDLFLVRETEAPQVFVKARGGLLTPTNPPVNWPVANALATGDLNNDLRIDVVMATDEGLQIYFGGLTNRLVLPVTGPTATGIALVDYDNDGWLDVFRYGEGLRAWRNLGLGGFRETTAELGLDRVATGSIRSLIAADFDGDCATDLLLAGDQGLRLLRNQGGNANRMLKLALLGNRSNSSGLGIRVELAAGRWRTVRTVNTLPVEIGVGKNARLDSLTAHWFDLSPSSTDVEVDCKAPLPLIELRFDSSGSCPYLYAWDGQRFRFITDLLGAAPLGLPIAEGRYVPADPDEFVWIGAESDFPARDGEYVLQITEELREVLYLDTAELVVVDHPPDTEVFTTGKLRPAGPFPPHEIVTLRNPIALKRAVRSDGTDVTEALSRVDHLHASPVAVRIPQLRGLAEPHFFTLDFGILPVERPLVLALTGWLRFGGGMANIAASHDPELPFPFPYLEVETQPDEWKRLEVEVGAPCGKTKSIVVDLTGHLPPGSRRLRLGAAFEIHWDRIALLEKDTRGLTRITRLSPDVADLHWRGFSEHEDLPSTLPVTPDYDRVRSRPNWRITPSGWCTRYGDVKELIERKDDALALLNGGDELTLKFAADRLPPREGHLDRGFFLFTSGWDKDADFHCRLGWLVEPLPWHGMDDQLYGEQKRPARDNDGWIHRYNTRWVEPLTRTRASR